MRKFLWGYALQTYPSSNCHLLPMAQHMTNSTAGHTEQRGGDCMTGTFVCYLWDPVSQEKTQNCGCVQIKFWSFWPNGKMCLLVTAKLEYDDLHLETFVSFYHMMLLAWQQLHKQITIVKINLFQFIRLYVSWKPPRFLSFPFALSSFLSSPFKLTRIKLKCAYALSICGCAFQVPSALLPFFPAT